MTQQKNLQNKARELLSNKTVDVVIGYGMVDTNVVGAVFVTNPDDAERLVWNNQCTPNLTVYLTRSEVKKLGKPAVVCKGCDAKTVSVLLVEKQLLPDDVVVIALECNGVAEYGQRQSKCLSCDVHKPVNCSIIIGNPAPADSAVPVAESRYAKVDRIMAMPPKERFAYWHKEFSRCIKCYACRQNCPLCYCNVCVTDKNRPIRLETSATVRGNFAWNILRAFHLAGRCIGCGSCTSACPAEIDLDVLNLCLSKSAEENFDYRPGYAPNNLPLIGAFSPDDSEGFIR